MKHKYLFYKEDNDCGLIDMSSLMVFDTIKEANEHLLREANKHINNRKSEFLDQDEFEDFREELLEEFNARKENVLYDPYYEVTFITKKIPYQEKK